MPQPSIPYTLNIHDAATVLLPYMPPIKRGLVNVVKNRIESRKSMKEETDKGATRCRSTIYAVAAHTPARPWGPESVPNSAKNCMWMFSVLNEKRERGTDPAPPMVVYRVACNSVPYCQMFNLLLVTLVC